MSVNSDKLIFSLWLSVWQAIGCSFRPPLSVVTLNTEVNIKCCTVCVSQSLSQWLAVWMWEVMFINAGANHSGPDWHSLTPFGLMSNWLTWTILSMNHQRLTKEEEGGGWAERDRENHNCCLIFDGWVNGFPCMLSNALESQTVQYSQLQWTPWDTGCFLARHFEQTACSLSCTACFC